MLYAKMLFLVEKVGGVPPAPQLCVPDAYGECLVCTVSAHACVCVQSPVDVYRNGVLSTQLRFKEI